MSKWISVKDRLPTKAGIYPACSRHPERQYVEDWADSLCMFLADAKAGEGKWQHVSGFYDHAITHWLELPEAPDA